MWWSFEARQRGAALQIEHPFSQARRQMADGRDLAVLNAQVGAAGAVDLRPRNQHERLSSRSTAALSAPGSDTGAVRARRSTPAAGLAKPSGLPPPASRLNQGAAAQFVNLIGQHARGHPGQREGNEAAAAREPAPPSGPRGLSASQRVGDGITGELMGAGRGTHQIGKAGRNPGIVAEGNPVGASANAAVAGDADPGSAGLPTYPLLRLNAKLPQCPRTGRLDDDVGPVRPSGRSKARSSGAPKPTTTLRLPWFNSA